MADEREERREIEAYLNEHHLQSFLGDAVNTVVKERPKDPLVRLAEVLRASSQTSREIQGVKGRQILNSEALPALQVEISTFQGCFYGSVTRGPFDNDDQYYDGRGLLRAIGSVGDVLAEVLVGKDPGQQAVVDTLMTQESSLPPNVVSAASLACCKAGAEQALMSVSEHVAIMSDNSEGEIPYPAFSMINGGQLAGSPLWVQDIFVVPMGTTVPSGQLLLASKIHRELENAARDFDQPMLQRGPRGGFCSSSGTFEQVMDTLVQVIQNLGFLGDVEIVVDVHASRLLQENSDESGEPTQRLYTTSTFSSNKGEGDLKDANSLLETYLEWLEKYPIIAFIEPFAPVDVSFCKELLNRGEEVLQAKVNVSIADGGEPSGGASSANHEGPREGASSMAHSRGESGIERNRDILLRVIADETVLTPARVAFVNEQRGANAMVISTSKMSSVSDCIALVGKAREVGWALFVSTASEEETEGEFILEVAMGLKAEHILMGGLRSASTLAACCRMVRKADLDVSLVQV